MGLKVGYGTLTKYLLPEFKKEHDVALACNYGLMGEQMTYLKDYPDIPIYGCGDPGFQEGTALDHYQRFEADFMMPIWDIWALVAIPQAALDKQIILCPYVPLDSEIPNPDMIRAAGACWKLIPMSQHAEEQFKKIFPEKTLPHIPGGVNTEIYKPAWRDMKEKGKIKKGLGFDIDTFLIGIGGDVKTQRKKFAENLEGIKKFVTKNPQLKVGVYVHTRMKPQITGDHNMGQLISDLGLQNICRSTTPINYAGGISEEEMSELYNGCDVWLQASAGEGFGLQFIEAQACGTAVIGTDFTAMSQVVGPKSGILVPPIHVGYDPIGGRKATPDPDKIVEALENLWNRTVKEPIKLRDEARSFAMKFDWETVIFPKWIKTLKQLEEELKRTCVIKPISPSEELIKVAGKVEVFG